MDLNLDPGADITRLTEVSGNNRLKNNSTDVDYQTKSLGTTWMSSLANVFEGRQTGCDTNIQVNESQG